MYTICNMYVIERDCELNTERAHSYDLAIVCSDFPFSVSLVGTRISFSARTGHLHLHIYIYIYIYMNIYILHKYTR